MGRVHINSAKLQASLMAMSQKAAERAASNYRDKIREEIAASGRVDTGEMMDRIRIEPGFSLPFLARWKVIPETKQFRFQDQGTRGTPYKPGRVLRFKPKGSGVFVFARSTGPIIAARFLAKAKARMSPSDFT